VSELNTHETNDPDPELLNIARLLRSSIDQQLDSFGEGIVPGSMDPVFDYAFIEVSKVILQERLSNLSNDDLVDLCVQMGNQPELLEMLEQVRAQRSLNLERELSLKAIAVEAERTRKISISSLPADEVINIGLFSSKAPKFAAKRYVDNKLERPFLRTLELRLIDPQNGEIELLNDIWHGPSWREDERATQLPLRARGIIGSASESGAGNVFNSDLTLHSQLSFKFGHDQDFTTPDQIIGYVETANGHMLLDGEK
jgi:hypothetical protein